MAASVTADDGRFLQLLGIWEISHAFYNAEMDEWVYVVPPSGEGEPGIVWQLLKAMYGTRRASRLFQQKVIDVLVGCDFKRLRVESMVFWH